MVYIFFILLSVSVCKEVSINYALFNKKLETRMYFDNKETNNITISISQQLPYNIINSYQAHLNSVIDYIPIIYDISTIFVNQYKGNLSLSLKIDPLNDLYLYGYNNIERNYISLAYQIKDNFSIIEKLYQQKIIDKRQYTIRPLTYFQGLIYFNDMSNIVDNKERAFCIIDERRITWGCGLKRVEFRDKEIFEFGKYATFMYDKRKMIAPCKFIHYVKEMIDKYISRTICDFEHRNGKMYLLCDQFYSKSYNVFKFVFNGVTVSLRIEDLFIFHAHEKCESYFKCYEGKEDIWIFGSNFLTNYMITFDYDEKHVSFYLSNYNPVEKNEEVFLYYNEKEIQNNILILIQSHIFVLLVMSTIQFYKLYNIKKIIINDSFHE